jgi:FkbM family methyltransferase
MDGRRGAAIDIRKVVRSGVTHFPWLADPKSRLQYAFHRLLHRPFEIEFLALEGLLSAQDLCLDVGANRGQSIDALKMLSFPVCIVAFEPQSNLYRGLLKRFRNDADVVVLPFGASDRASNTELYVPYYAGYCFDGLGSMQLDRLDEWLRASIYRFDERKLEIRAMPCRTVRLDDLMLGNIAFIKLDIQGSEYAALVGAADTLRRDRPHLMIETPSPDVHDFLERLGYTQYVYSEGRLRKSTEWALNAFFLT